MTQLTKMRLVADANYLSNLLRQESIGNPCVILQSKQMLLEADGHTCVIINCNIGHWTGTSVFTSLD